MGSGGSTGDDAGAGAFTGTGTGGCGCALPPASPFAAAAPAAFLISASAGISGRSPAGAALHLKYSSAGSGSST